MDLFDEDSEVEQRFSDRCWKSKESKIFVEKSVSATIACINSCAVLCSKVQHLKN